MGEFEEAQKIYAQVVEQLLQSEDKDHPSVVACRNSIAQNALAQSQFTTALPLCKDVLRVNLDRLGPDHLVNWRIQHDIAQCLLNTTDADGAEQLWLELWGRIEKLPPPLFPSETKLQRKIADGLIRLYEATADAGKQQDWQTELERMKPMPKY
jgi:hypothetical protein